MVAVVWFAMLGWALALSFADLRERRLPNVLTIPGAAVILAGATVAGRGAAAMAGGLGLAAVYLVVHLAQPRGMGAGDVKLALGLGAVTGAFGVGVWTIAALGAPALSAAFGAASAVRGGSRAVPHGPSMCLVSLIAVVVAML
ncbi:MAG: prepilin peptidase [Mycobacterium sp.]